MAISLSQHIERIGEAEPAPSSPEGIRHDRVCYPGIARSPPVREEPMRIGGRKGKGSSGGETLRTIGLASLIAILLASSVGLVAAARTLDLSPRVGDILVFRPGTQLPLDWIFPAVNQSAEVASSC